MSLIKKHSFNHINMNIMKNQPQNKNMFLVILDIIEDNMPIIKL